jgi:hypothetical protein
MVDRVEQEPRCEWDNSILLRRLVAIAWVTLARNGAAGNQRPQHPGGESHAEQAD